MTYFFEVQLKKLSNNDVLIGIIVRETAHGDVTGFTQHASSASTPLSEAIARTVQTIQVTAFLAAAKKEGFIL